MSKAAKPVVIKKYANRRLYNTETSSYVTLEQLCGLVKENRNFVVYDAKNGEDITRTVLTQIIVEEEEKAEQSLLPIDFLKQLIRFYDDAFKAVLPGYLDFSMKALMNSRDQFYNQAQSAPDDAFPFGSFEEMSKRQTALVENAMRFWAPFFPAPTERRPVEADDRQTIDALRREIDELRAKVEEIGQKKTP